jgi:hypothetical protein
MPICYDKRGRDEGCKGRIRLHFSYPGRGAGPNIVSRWYVFAQLASCSQQAGF